MMGDYNFQVDMGGPYRDAFNADLNVRAAASDRRWTDKAAEVAALAAAQATRDSTHKPLLSGLGKPPKPGELLQRAGPSSSVSQERIERQAESPAPPRPSLQESQAAHWARLLQLADGHRGVRMPPVAPFARQASALTKPMRPQTARPAGPEPILALPSARASQAALPLPPPRSVPTARPASATPPAPPPTARPVRTRVDAGSTISQMDAMTLDATSQPPVNRVVRACNRPASAHASSSNPATAAVRQPQSWLRYYVPAAGLARPSYGSARVQADAERTLVLPPPLSAAAGAPDFLRRPPPAPTPPQPRHLRNPGEAAVAAAAATAARPPQAKRRPACSAEASDAEEEAATGRESYKPVSAEVSEIAREIGLDAAQHPELMWIAEDYFLAQLPDGWIEHPDAASGKLYYFNPTLNRSQWQHPLEGYFRGLVYMRIEGDRLLAEREARAPPSEQEVDDLCVYFGVDKEREPAVVPLVRAAVSAPVPFDWREVDQADGEDLFYLHTSGIESKQHPLDAYFVHCIRRAREGDDERGRGGGGGGGDSLGV